MKYKTKKVDEALNYNEFKDVDPYGEENWDEYEVQNSDVFYAFFDINNDIVPAVLNVDSFNNSDIILKVVSSTNKDLIGKKISLSGDIVEKINTKQLYTSPVDVLDNVKLIAIVLDKKFSKYYKNVSEAIRKYEFNKTTLLNKEIKKLNDEIESLEKETIELKKEIITEDDFIPPEDIELDEDEYVYIKINATDPKNIKVTNGIYELSGSNDKGFVYLVDKETGTRGPSVKEKLKKLKENKWIHFKPANVPTSTDYSEYPPIRFLITSDVKQFYPQMIEHTISSVNKIIKTQIEKNREKLKELMEEEERLSNERKEARKKYLELNTQGIIKKLKELINS
jgi:hypothetical protein